MFRIQGYTPALNHFPVTCPMKFNPLNSARHLEGINNFFKICAARFLNHQLDREDMFLVAPILVSVILAKYVNFSMYASPRCKDRRCKSASFKVFTDVGIPVRKCCISNVHEITTTSHTHFKMLKFTYQFSSHLGEV